MKKHTGGYSLFEAVVYVAIFAVLSIVVVNSLIIVTNTFLDMRIERNLNATALSSVDRIVREARLANNVDTINSTFDAHPGRLTLESEDLGGNPKTVEFYLENGTLKVRENGMEAGALTPGNISVNNLVFRLITNGATQAVKIEATLMDTRGANPQSRNFYNTALIRGTY